MDGSDSPPLKRARVGAVAGAPAPSPTPSGVVETSVNMSCINTSSHNAAAGHVRGHHVGDPTLGSSSATPAVLAQVASALPTAVVSLSEQHRDLVSIGGHVGVWSAEASQMQTAPLVHASKAHDAAELDAYRASYREYRRGAAEGTKTGSGGAHLAAKNETAPAIEEASGALATVNALALRMAPPLWVPSGGPEEEQKFNAYRASYRSFRDGGATGAAGEVTDHGAEAAESEGSTVAAQRRVFCDNKLLNLASSFVRAVEASGLTRIAHVDPKSLVDRELRSGDAAAMQRELALQPLDDGKSEGQEASLRKWCTAVFTLNADFAEDAPDELARARLAVGELRVAMKQLVRTIKRTAPALWSALGADEMQLNIDAVVAQASDAAAAAAAPSIDLDQFVDAALVLLRALSLARRRIAFSAFLETHFDACVGKELVEHVPADWSAVRRRAARRALVRCPAR